MFNRPRSLVGFPRWLAPTLSAMLFLLLSGLYRSQTPLFETPDEPSHFSVVQYMATWKRLPPLPTELRTSPVPAVSEHPPNYYAPPLFYALAAPLLIGLDTAGYSSNALPNPYFELGWAVSTGDDLTSKNMYIHTAEQRHPPADWAIGMQRARTLSMLFSAATVFGAAILVHRVWPEKRQRGWRWSALALVVLNPTFLFTGYGVSNDTLLVALSTCCFVVCSDILTRDDAQQASRALLGRRGFVLAVILGCAALTKQSGLLLAAPIGATVILVARRGNWTIKRTIAVLLAGSVLTLIIAGWWYGRNAWMAGDPLALEPHPGLAIAGGQTDQMRFFAGQLLGVFRSYWAGLGWATIFAHEWWYLWFGILTVGGVAGWSVRGSRDLGWPAGLSALLWSGLAVYLVFLIAWLLRTAAPYGRLMFPVIAPAACIIMEGWRRWLAPSNDHRRRLSTLFQGGVILSMLAIALLMPFGYLRPAFQSPLASREELPDFTPVGSVFGERLRLVGYSVENDGQSGEPLWLTLYWEPAAAQITAHDFMTEVQLAPADAESWVAGDIAFLGTGRYPTSVWRAGDLIVQRHSLLPPADSPAPALYWIGVGVTPRPGEERLPVTSGLPTGAGGLVRLGPIRLYPADGAATEASVRTDYQLGTAIALQGYDVAWNEPDRRLSLTLHWKALSPMPDDWTVFVHLVDGNGSLVGQGDAPPMGGNFPTSWWRAGDVVTDRHEVVLLAGFEQQELYLLVGLYDPPSGVRLVVTGVDGQEVPNGAISIPVQP